MEFHKKLQELRKQKGLTQEQVAAFLYVSRTAVSKWEAGRGYPNLDSLKAIAKFFDITVDELLSSDELLTVAQEDKKRAKKTFLDLIYGLLDISVAMLFFLPFFATKTGTNVESVSLLALGGVQPYLRVCYWVMAVATVLTGIATLALQNCAAPIWIKGKRWLSLLLGAALALLFIISSQPYAAVFAFVLLTMKTLTLIKR
ncbi:MAG: helix-turn-helix transcriptional regulator [Clostridia bacterium]|nr:helix-turn-helix transcriptional regulator [Clostridia bacterium]